MLRKFNGDNRKKAVVEVIINEIKRDILIKLFIQRYYQKENINVFSFVLIDSCVLDDARRLFLFVSLIIKLKCNKIYETPT